MKKIPNSESDKNKKIPDRSSAKFLFSFKVQFIILIFSVIAFFCVSIFFNPSLIDPINYEPPKLIKLEGPLSFNQLLNKTEVINYKIRGGESNVFHDGSLYTGTHDGRIVKLFKDENLEFAKFGSKKCNKTYECGRPLGIRKDVKSEHLYVVDAYFGLFRVSLKDGTHKKLFPIDETQYSSIRFFNDFDMLSEDLFIMTDSSSKFPYHQMIFNFIEASSLGKVLLVDIKKGTFQVLAENLFFPNGVQISSDKKYVFVAESGNGRILKLPIPSETSDAFKGKVELLVPHLPGVPDNIRESPRGGYWIAMPHLFYLGNPGLMYNLAHYPRIRWLIHKVLTPSLLYYLSASKSSMAIRIDEEGNFLESLQIHDSNHHVNVAEVIELTNGTLFFGSFYLPNVRRLDLKDLK